MIIILYCVLVYFAYYNKKIMKNKFRLKIIKIIIFFYTKIGYLPLQCKKIK